MPDAKRILTVDCDDSIRRLLKRLLTKEGYSVDEAKDASEGWRKVIACGYDLILLDAMMPGLESSELLRYIQYVSGLDAELEKAKILFISEDLKLPATELAMISYNRRVVGFIEKPLIREVLLEKLKTALSSGIRSENPAADFPKEAPLGDVELESGSSYLVEGVWPVRGIQFMLGQKALGRNSIYVTRFDPDRLRKKFPLDGVRIIWLTRMNEDPAVESVCGLQDLTMFLSEFVRKNPKGAVLLDGLEYLIVNNDFQMVLRFIQHIRDLVSTSECILLMMANPAALDARQISLLENECIRLP